MDELTDLLVTFICKSTMDNVDVETLNSIRSRLTEQTGRDFGLDVDMWAGWYRTEAGDPDGQRVVATVYKMYKTRKRIDELGRRRDKT